MLQQEPTYPKPGLARKALIAGGMMKP